MPSIRASFLLACLLAKSCPLQSSSSFVADFAWPTRDFKILVGYGRSGASPNPVRCRRSCPDGHAYGDLYFQIRLADMSLSRLPVRLQVRLRRMRPKIALKLFPYSLSLSPLPPILFLSTSTDQFAFYQHELAISAYRVVDAKWLGCSSEAKFQPKAYCQ